MRWRSRLTGVDRGLADRLGDEFDHARRHAEPVDVHRQAGAHAVAQVAHDGRRLEAASLRHRRLRQSAARGRWTTTTTGDLSMARR